MARATETGGTGSPSEWPIAIAASCLAGFVDALGFLASKGFFVSFMSGNSTQLGAEIAGGATLALVPVALVLAFVAGALSGALVARRSGTRRRPVVLTLVAAVLAAAALSAWQGANALALVAMAAAMGAENAAFETNGEVKIAVTYMTGTLVKVGQRIADALEGGSAGPGCPMSACGQGWWWAQPAARCCIRASASPDFGLRSPVRRVWRRGRPPPA